MNLKFFVALTLISGIASSTFLSNNAHASRARTQVMGTGDAGLVLNGGSFYFDDSYNIFYNPSYINDFKNWAIIEKSNSPGTSAQGGFVGALMNFSFGFYMNRVSLLQNYNSQSFTTYTNETNMRPTEFFFGGDMGMKWGVELELANYRTGGQTDSDVTLRAGAQVMGFEPFVAVRLSGDDPSATQKETYFSLGTRYKWGEWIPYVGLTSAKTKVSDVDVIKTTNYVIGIGRNARVAEGITLSYALAFARQAASPDRSIVPIDFAVEGNPATWVTLRAGLGFHLVDRRAGETVADNTTGRLGASFHVGKVDINFAAGKSGTTSQAASPVTESATVLDSQSFDLSNNFFSIASLEYRW